MIAVAATIAVVGGGVFAYTEYDRPTKGAKDMHASQSVTAADLHAAFITDETTANTQFVGTKEQAIRVNGVVRLIEPVTADLVNVVLETNDAMAGVVCEFNTKDVPKTWNIGDSVALKGICTGVNDLIPDVILVRCGAVE